MKRIFQNLLFFPWRARMAFPATALRRIEQAIGASEKNHCGELRFVIEGSLDLAALWHGVTARQRAIDVFAQLRVWDTEENSGVLIYVLLAERRVEIVADRGINRRVEVSVWRDICAAMENAFRQGRYADGAVAGIESIGRLLSAHFPAGRDNPDELDNAPVRL